MNKTCIMSFGDVQLQQNGYYIRVLTLAKHLRDQGHNVTIYQFSNNNEEIILDNIKIVSLKSRNKSVNLIDRILSPILGFNLFDIILFQIRSYNTLIRKKSEFISFNNYYIEGCLLIQAFIFLKKIRKYIILDTICINEDVANKMINIRPIEGYIRKFIWHIIENYILRNSNEIIAVSEDDKLFISNHFHIPENRIRIIPHKVRAASRLTFNPQALALKKKLNKHNKKIILFIGDLGAIHNKEAVDYIKNKLSLKLPNYLFVIVGNNPDKLINKNNIIYTDFVNDIDPYIILADICIAPLSFGSGIKTKILDYMKYFKPIITTSIGSEGIDLFKYNNIYITDRDKMANIIIHLTKY